MKPAKLTYTNHRGETAQRIITPLFMLYGETEWHPEPQWLIHAFDHEKREVSDFALKDFGYPAPAAQPTIKALEWKKSALLTMWQKQLIVRVTDTVLGRFSVCQAAATVSGPLPPAWIGPDGVHHEVADVEAGVAAVEAHYERVIRSALAHPAQGGDRG